MLEQSHVIITQLLTLQNGRIDDYENRLANAQNAAIPSHETPEQVPTTLGHDTSSPVTSAVQWEWCH
jgi:hypothetical protein